MYAFSNYIFLLGFFFKQSVNLYVQMFIQAYQHFEQLSIYVFRVYYFLEQWSEYPPPTKFVMISF